MASWPYHFSPQTEVETVKLSYTQVALSLRAFTHLSFYMSRLQKNMIVVFKISAKGHWRKLQEDIVALKHRVFRNNDVSHQPLHHWILRCTAIFWKPLEDQSNTEIQKQRQFRLAGSNAAQVKILTLLKIIGDELWRMGYRMIEWKIKRSIMTGRTKRIFSQILGISLWSSVTVDSVRRRWKKTHRRFVGFLSFRWQK